MGVYIKGMEMPTEKPIAVVIHPDGTAYCAEMSAGVCTEYLQDCVAIPISPHDEWIPVTERLPDEYVSVLCYCSRNGQYGCGERCKEDNGTIYWIGLNGMIPTHWMPLPEQPATKDGE